MEALRIVADSSPLAFMFFVLCASIVILWLAHLVKHDRQKGELEQEVKSLQGQMVALQRRVTQQLTPPTEGEDG